MSVRCSSLRSATFIAVNKASTFGETTNRLFTSPRTLRRLFGISRYAACCKNEGCVAAVTYVWKIMISSGVDKLDAAAPTSSKIPLPRRIFTAPLWWICSCPITPSNFASWVAESPVWPSGAADVCVDAVEDSGWGGLESGAKDTLFGVVTEVWPGSVLVDIPPRWGPDFELKIGKGLGNWKK